MQREGRGREGEKSHLPFSPFLPFASLCLLPWILTTLCFCWSLQWTGVNGFPPICSGGVINTTLYNVLNYPAGMMPLTVVTEDDLQQLKDPSVYPRSGAMEKFVVKVRASGTMLSLKKKYHNWDHFLSLCSGSVFFLIGWHGSQVSLEGQGLFTQYCWCTVNRISDKFRFSGTQVMVVRGVAAEVLIWIWE